MRKNAGMLCFVLVFLLFSAVSAWSLDFNPGQYDVTSVIQMPNIPGMPAMPQGVVVSQCITENDTVPEKAMAASGCQVMNQKMSGNTVSWEMKCNQQGMSSSGSGKMTYAGDSFSGDFQINMGPNAGNMVMNTQITGKRSGPCEK